MHVQWNFSQHVRYVYHLALAGAGDGRVIWRETTRQNARDPEHQAGAQAPIQGGGMILWMKSFQDQWRSVPSRRLGRKINFAAPFCR